MCAPVMLGMAAVGALGAISGQREQDKMIGEQVAAQNAQKQNIVRQMNYDLQSIDAEQRDLYDDAIAQLQGNSINSLRNQGMIAAAFGESGLEGRSVDAALREVRGQDARVADSIRGSFDKTWAGNQQAKEVAVLNADSSIKGMPRIQGPSTASRVLGVINGGLQGASMGANLSGMMAKANTPTKK